ncbi:MAG: hypothetical protein WDM89_07595 [Rhizomicrobium sp.]
MIIADSFKFILFFVEDELKRELRTSIADSALQSIRAAIYKRNELEAIADRRLNDWMKDSWPEWDEKIEDTPEQFSGTDDCPVCRESYLVMGYHETSFCFHCNASVPAKQCEGCGATFLANEGCHCCYNDEEYDAEYNSN